MVTIARMQYWVWVTVTGVAIFLTGIPLAFVLLRLGLEALPLILLVVTLVTGAIVFLLGLAGLAFTAICGDR